MPPSSSSRRRQRGAHELPGARPVPESATCENDRIPSILRGGNSQTTLGQCAVRHRLGRIEDEIVDDLLDLDPIGKNAR